MDQTHSPARPTPAVGAVCFKDEHVLLIRRGTAPLQGQWSLPGGRIELGEKAADAALRELKEETGVDARLIGLIDVVDAIFTSRRTGETSRHYVLADYAAVWVSGEPVAGDDAAEAAFFPMTALNDLELWDETERIIHAAHALL